MGRGLIIVVLLACLTLAACGSGDNQTVFVLPSGSASVGASAGVSTAPATGSPSPAASGTTQPVGTAATPIPGGSKIVIDSPDASTAITSPVQVSGAASVASGTVVAVVLDSGGTELGRAQTTASASAPDFGHYDVSVSFSGAASGSRGQLKVFGVRADGTTPTWYYFISVRFA